MILIAPDAFKGTFSAAEVADAIGAGVRDAGVAADLCPVADGGEGTMAILLAALGGTAVGVDVRDPLGRPLRAAYGLLDDGTAIVEVAAASGLGLVSPGERDAEKATSRGTGGLIAAAVGGGARRVLVAVGGSATTDGGAGAIAAIEEAGGLRGAELIALCDVQVAFEQAATVFAPQKGADADAVARLTSRLEALAQRLPRDPRGVPMTGGAGGLSGGLWATYGAQLCPGAAWVLDAVGFDARVAGARAVVTGEGRLDAQTLHGKIAGEVAARCRRAGVPLYAIVGSTELEPDALGLADVLVASTVAALRAAGAEVAHRVAGAA